MRSMRAAESGGGRAFDGVWLYVGYRCVPAAPTDY